MTIALEPPIAGVWMTNLTGRFVRPDGTPVTGTLSFAPPGGLLLPDGPLMSACSAEVELDFNGQFSVWLISTDNPDMSPTGWTYTVTEKLDCGPQRRYSIFLPHDPQVVDLAQIAPSYPYSGRYLPVVGPTGPQGPQGPPGPPGPAVLLGGEIQVAQTDAPVTPGVLPMVLLPGFTGMTGDGTTVTPPTDSSWTWTGGLLFTSESTAQYIMDVDVWLTWPLFNGEIATTQIASGSGPIGGPAGNNRVLDVGVDWSFSAVNTKPITLYVQTFGRESDTSVKVFGGFLATQIQDRSGEGPGVLAPLSGHTPVAVEGPVVPGDGTDAYLLWTGQWIEGDNYKRGLTVTWDNHTYVATKDFPAGRPAESDDWALISTRVAIEGGAFNLATVVAEDSTPTQIPLAAVSQLVSVHLISGDGGIVLEVPGTWMIAGTVDLSSGSATEVDYSIDTWVEWTRPDGSVRKSEVTTNHGTAGDGKTFNNRIDFTAIFTESVSLRVFSQTTEIDGLPANLTGQFSASLLMERHV